MNKDFKSFATANCGVSGTTLDKIESKLIIPQAYINPTILEERQLNVTQMDVFSRLMADRIIFLGTEIDDTVANVIIAQLLYLSSQDPEASITMYLNTPGGSVYDGLLQFMILCNIFLMKFRLSAQDWPLLWVLFFCVLEKRASVLHCRIVVL